VFTPQGAGIAPSKERGGEAGGLASGLTTPCVNDGPQTPAVTGIVAAAVEVVSDEVERGIQPRRGLMVRERSAHSDLYADSEQ